MRRTRRRSSSRSGFAEGRQLGRLRRSGRTVGQSGPVCWESIYLDIETTGLSPYESEITVIGLCRERTGRREVVQLVGNQVAAGRLVELVAGARTLYSYNGSRFDLPFIKTQLGVDLTEVCPHRDLMYDCWNRNLRGGLKGVERQLGIRRRLVGINGFMAVQLWWEYSNNADEQALKLLRAYNREDVVNLRVLKRKLGL